MVVRRPCCMSGRCIGLGIGGTMPMRMARCSGGVAKGWIDRSDCAWSVFHALKKSWSRKPSG